MASRRNLFTEFDVIQHLLDRENDGDDEGFGLGNYRRGRGTCTRGLSGGGGG